MLSTVKLKNFKSFSELNNLKLKPITVLCGTNSCGKSSILQSILLLKQTKEVRSTNQSLVLNGKYVHLGDIQNIIYGHNEDETVSLTYQYDFTTEEYYTNRRNRHQPSIARLFRYLLSAEIMKIKNAVYSLSLSIELKVSEKNKGYIKTSDIISYKVSISSTSPNGALTKGLQASIIRIGSDFELKWENVHHVIRRNTSLKAGSVKGLSVSFENLFPFIEIRDSGSLESTFDAIPFEVQHVFRAVDDFITNINEGITYVGPLREEPSRRYIRCFSRQLSLIS